MLAKSKAHSSRSIKRQPLFSLPFGKNGWWLLPQERKTHVRSLHISGVYPRERYRVKGDVSPEKRVTVTCTSLWRKASAKWVNVNLTGFKRDLNNIPNWSPMCNQLSGISTWTQIFLNKFIQSQMFWVITSILILQYCQVFDNIYQMWHYTSH